MANDTNSDVVSAASDNLKLTIGGLVEVAVTLARVLENNGRQPVPAGAATPSGNARHASADDNADDGICAAMEALGVDDGARARPRPSHPDRRRPDRPNPQPNRMPPQHVPRARVGAANARVKGDRHYAVFTGKEVGVTQKW